MTQTGEECVSGLARSWTVRVAHHGPTGPESAPHLTRSGQGSSGGRT